MLPCEPNPSASKCDRPCPTKLRYVQPERVKSFKPLKQYVQLNTPMELCSIYKNSYPSNDSNIMACVRSPPIKPQPQIKLGHEKIETTTVTNVNLINNILLLFF